MDIPSDLAEAVHPIDGWDVEVADRAKLSPAPVVSVSLSTYQHARFIRQALDSVLSQQVDFPIEICLGEDGSTDGTREICLDYVRRCPDRVRLFLRDRANPVRSQYPVPFAHNGLSTLRSCRGQFVALLDGDDYWTDPQKLSTQVALMRRDPGCAICYHNVAVTYDGQQTTSHPFFVRTPWGDHMARVPPGRCTVQRLATGNFIPTPSVLYRNTPPLPVPDWITRCWACDWALHLSYAQRGDLVYLDRTMAAYRVHGGGAWSAIRAQDRLQRWIVQLGVMDEAFQQRHRRPFLAALRGAYVQVIRHHPDLDLYTPGLPRRAAAILEGYPTTIPTRPSWRRATLRDALAARFHRCVQEGDYPGARHLLLHYVAPSLAWFTASYLAGDTVEALAGPRVAGALRQLKRRVMGAAAGAGRPGGR